MKPKLNYLAQAAVAWREGVVSRQKVNLSVGRLLHLHILTTLQDLDAEHSGTRVYAYRKDMIAAAAEKLEVSGEKIRRFIQTAMAVDLLVDGKVGDTSFEKLTLFCPFVERKKDAIHSVDDLPYADTECWEVTNDAAKDALQKVIRENMTYRDSWKLAMSLNKEKPAPNRGKGTWSGGAERPTWRQQAADDAEGEPLRIDVKSTVKVCSPREAAELLYQEILSNHDPIATAHHLASKLQSKQFEADVRELNRAKRKTA